MATKLKVKPFCLNCFITWGYLPDNCEDCSKLMDINVRETILISEYGEIIQKRDADISQCLSVIEQYEEERNKLIDKYNKLMKERNRLKKLLGGNNEK